MHSGAIDSAMMDYGEAFRSKKMGLKLLINAADFHGLLAGGLGVNSGKLRDQPDQVRRVMKAMLQALRYLRKNPEGTQQIMMSWLKLDREMAAEGSLESILDIVGKDVRAVSQQPLHLGIALRDELDDQPPA